MVVTALPSRCVILARLSQFRDTGRSASTVDQIADCRALASKLGWTVGPEATHVIVEDDTSAYKRRRTKLPNGRVELRTVRPEFRRALSLLADGAADGMVAVDLDRTCRDPRDLEDLIDLVESRSPRLPVESVTGSLRLATDADVTMARVQVAIANKSSRDTARRVARARLRTAMAGGHGGGPRPYGFEADGLTVRGDEADQLRAAADAFLTGASLRSLAVELGKTTATLRYLLSRPRTAGLVSYKGELLEGVSLPGEPILSRERWEAVCALLSSPGRRTTPGPTPRWLGSGLYVCGHPGCDGKATRLRIGGGPGRTGRRQYRCPTEHMSRVAEPLDAWVTEVVVARLARPDAARAFARRVGVDARSLADEAAHLRARITEAGDMWEAGEMTRGDYAARTERMRERLATVESRLATAQGESPLADITGPGDVRARWDGLGLARQRAILDRVLTVVVLPQGRGAARVGLPTFDPAYVRFDWRE